MITDSFSFCSWLSMMLVRMGVLIWSFQVYSFGYEQTSPWATNQKKSWLEEMQTLKGARLNDFHQTQGEVSGCIKAQYKINKDYFKMQNNNKVSGTSLARGLHSVSEDDSTCSCRCCQHAA